jgi:hypothetical protein
VKSEKIFVDETREVILASAEAAHPGKTGDSVDTANEEGPRLTLSKADPQLAQQCSLLLMYKQRQAIFLSSSLEDEARLSREDARARETRWEPFPREWVARNERIRIRSAQPKQELLTPSQARFALARSAAAKENDTLQRCNHSTKHSTR